MSTPYTSRRGYFKPTEAALERWTPLERLKKEIKHYQTSQDLLIPVKPFTREVRYLTSVEVDRMYDPVHGTYPPEEKHQFRWQGEALFCLQEAAEGFLAGHLMGAWWCALHAGRQTLMDKDIFLECRLQGMEAVGDEAGKFKKHDTLLDSGLVNLDPAFSYKDYPKYKGKEHVKESGRLWWNAQTHDVLRKVKRPISRRKSTPSKKTATVANKTD